MLTKRILVLSLRAALPGLALSAAAAHADATFTVNTLADALDDDLFDGVCHTNANTCSLRAATQQANVASGLGATIVLPAGHYVLTRPTIGNGNDDNGDLDFKAPTSGHPEIHLVGAGAATTIIDANQIDRVLKVEARRTATISGVTLKGGFRASDPGGGIENLGTLTLTNCVVENNATNSAGGGIFNLGNLEVVNSTIRSNTATFGGGGLFISAHTVLRNSTVSGNGSADNGGGILVAFYNAIVPMLIAVNSTISQNYANTDGGGIASEGSDTFLYNSSVIGNDADHDRDQTGGIGGGIRAFNNARVLVVNSLIANNTILDAPIADNCNGSLEAYGINRLDDSTGCTSSTSAANLGYVSPNTIGPLQNNGGPTMTHALLAGSEAIDGTHPSVGCIDENGNPLATDQRGAARVVGARCDVGAFEFGGAVDRIFASGFE